MDTMKQRDQGSGLVRACEAGDGQKRHTQIKRGEACFWWLWVKLFFLTKRPEAKAQLCPFNVAHVLHGWASTDLTSSVMKDTSLMLNQPHSYFVLI